MQHVSPSDRMTGSAKAAIDTALDDAKRQQLRGGATKVVLADEVDAYPHPSTPAAPPTPAAAPPGRPGISA